MTYPLPIPRRNFRDLLRDALPDKGSDIDERLPDGTPSQFVTLRRLNPAGDVWRDTQEQAGPPALSSLPEARPNMFSKIRSVVDDYKPRQTPQARPADNQPDPPRSDIPVLPPFTRARFQIAPPDVQFSDLPTLSPMSAGPTGMEVTPFVFVTEHAVEPCCGPEAESSFWLPLPLVASGELSGTYTYPGTDRTFPTWNFEGHVIWGLTYRILAELL